MIQFVKREFVLIISVILAISSMFFVPPSMDYIEYIDFSVISILFCLMAVVAGFKQSGLFDYLSTKLLAKSNNIKILTAIFTGLCFFSAMLITNDVALITFVPLTIMVFNGISQKRIIFIIVLETIASNLGSMLTPIGNPQNLYIYSFYKMNITEFFNIVAPVTVISFMVLTLIIAFGKSNYIKCTIISTKTIIIKYLFLYVCLFLLCTLTVLHIIDYKISLSIIIIALLVFDRGIYKKVDYALLGTFFAFFILVGNLGNIPVISTTLSQFIEGKELLTSILVSQVISNVPAAVMLSKFTENIKELLLGVNIGGLGTLIASLASLISYKLYAKTENAKTVLFLGIFTLMNTLVLAFITLIAIVYLHIIQ